MEARPALPCDKLSSRPEADPDMDAEDLAAVVEEYKAAAKSWQSAITLAPDSPAAATAKDYLAQIGDAGEPAPAQPTEEAPKS